MIGKGEDFKFYAEPLIGYRIWRMDDEELLLRGCVHTQEWPVEEDATAICLRSRRYTHHPYYAEKPHKPNYVPVKGCGCGFYGYFDYEFLQRSRAPGGQRLMSLRGVVIGWGKGLLAEHGWRAKHARPVALLHWPERRRNVHEPFHESDEEDCHLWNGIAMRIAERYNVPYVRTAAELEEAAYQIVRSAG